MFFFNDTATSEIYTFPYTTLFRSQLHRRSQPSRPEGRRLGGQARGLLPLLVLARHGRERRRVPPEGRARHGRRSEEHTSELQSRQYLVCRLLLEKKKTQDPDLDLQ